MRVETLAISFSLALVRRGTALVTFMKLPSMIMPMSGRPLGAMRPVMRVTMMGNAMRAVCETLPSTLSIFTSRSLRVVRARMIGSWMIGTSAMYE